MKKKKIIEVKFLNLNSHFYLKWSWRATLRSKESPRSANPIPINADLPLSSWILITKYRLESETVSKAGPGKQSIGHFAKSLPLALSSIFSMHWSPLLTNLRRPVQSGSSSFQSEALLIFLVLLFELMTINLKKLISQAQN